MSFDNSQYDVVLVHPPAEIVLEIYDLPDFPNIGIAYIGNYLQKSTGITPALIDAKFSRLSLGETVDQIVKLQPKVLGLGAMTPMVTSAMKVLTGVKRALPEVKTVLGGIHATFLPERSLDEFSVIDYIVVGEGEMAFGELCQNILDGDNTDKIPGVWSRSGSGVIDNGSGITPNTLDELGEPGWHLYDSDEISKYCRSLPVMGQRGCPFSCTFCSRPYGQLVRKRTPSLIADEIEANSRKYGVEKFHFYDETFSVDKKHISRLCLDLTKRKFPVPFAWTCTVHANTLDQELADLMKFSGCVFTGYGVETGDEDIMAQMNKGVTKEGILRARAILRKAGITTSAYFMLGHPNESRMSILRTILFAVRLNPDIAAIGIMVPYPGTEIWNLAQNGESGYMKLSENWADYNKQLGNAVQLKNISRREIEIFQLVGYASIYFFNFRFKDMFKIIQENTNLLISVIAKIILPNSLAQKFVLFRNDGGRVWKEKQKKSWGL